VAGKICEALCAGLGGARSHAVLVVDCSGSMRKDDVPGHATRTAAVYECLARKFVEPQIKLSTNGGVGPVAGDAVVTIIEVGPSRCASPRHRMPFNSSNEGSKVCR
jgi:hypothetical protein